MNKPEWMPANPCGDCDIEDKERREHRYGFDNECQCDDLHCYFQEVYYQKKLLSYLANRSPVFYYFEDNANYIRVINSMLKELDGNDDR